MYTSSASSVGSMTAAPSVVAQHGTDRNHAAITITLTWMTLVEVSHALVISLCTSRRNLGWSFDIDLNTRCLEGCVDRIIIPSRSERA